MSKNRPGVDRDRIVYSTCSIITTSYVNANGKFNGVFSWKNTLTQNRQSVNLTA